MRRRLMERLPVLSYELVGESRGKSSQFSHVNPEKVWGKPRVPKSSVTRF